MQGTLTPSYGLADVVRGIYGGRRSGILSVRHGTEIKQLYFEKGSFVFSETSDPSWRFGTLLVRRGKLGQEDLDHVLTLLAPGRRIGGVLRDLGYLSDAGLAEAVAFQITEHVYAAFSWSEGDYEFTEQEAPAPSDVAVAMSTANVIMEGVRRIADAEFLGRALGPPDQLVSLGSNPLLRFQSIFLQPKEGFILSRIEGVLTIEEVVALSPVPEDEVLRCLYGLRCTGILDVRPREEAASLREEDGDVAAFFTDFAGVEQFLGARTVDMTQTLALSPEEEQEQREIIGLSERIGDLDVHAVLGVSPGADGGAIRKAYYRLAKRYHPDRHHKSHLTGLQDKLERIFVRVNEAYEALKDGGKPQAQRRTGPAPAAARETAAAAPPDPAADAARRRQVAESSFREGKALLEKGDYFNAIRAFQIAVQTAPDKPTYQSYLGRALGKNPKWRKEAEEHLLKAAELEPAEAEHFAQIGLLYEAAGLHTRADRYFDEALRRDPDNRTAALGRAKREVEARRGGGKGGGLRSLFGDKGKPPPD